MANPATQEWTCDDCTVTASWMGDSEQGGLPPHWVEEGGVLYCLQCRRDRAAEAAVSDQDVEVLSGERRVQLRKIAMIEFELQRDPERANGLIARACHTSTPAVVKARRRLEEGGHSAGPSHS